MTEPGVGTNRFAYSFNDPVNLSDRNGNATISNGDDHVYVDADGDGDVDDDDLPEEQREIFSRDNADFIKENSGEDLSEYGVKGTIIGTTAFERYVRTASQFIGFDLEGGFPEDTKVVPGNLTNRPLSSETAGRLDKRTDLQTRETTYTMYINLDAYNQRENASELARTMLHEYLHRDDQIGAVYAVNDAHRAIDDRAKQMLKDNGLANGGCSSVGGFAGIGGNSGC